jgi:hypothetical protein
VEILERWQKAGEAGIKREKFCEDEGIEISELVRFQEWQRQRQSRQ